MSDIVISVDNLSKKYLIGHQSAERGRYTALRDVLAFQARSFWRKAASTMRGEQLLQGDTIEEFWALKDVSFEVKQGEVVGIIGRNGAGKSTLLKVLSRITEPTTGKVRLRGRVTSLLEVGTGFHLELTGRENIFLNGAILGLTRAEIKQRFDEIVAFAEIEAFLDTPVKRYSSGMYVRLAFAVAAHLDPDILIVDEVLAVGDAEFQKKCLGKMDETARAGRTVLFVSHDLRRIGALCSRGILLNAGRIEFDAPMSSVIESYLVKQFTVSGAVDFRDRKDRTGSGDSQFQSIKLCKGGTSCGTFSIGDCFEQHIRVKVKRRIGPLVISSSIVTSDGISVYQLLSTDDGFSWSPEVGDFDIRIVTDKLLLYPGTYSIDLWMGDRNSMRVDYLPQAISFTVMQETNSVVDRELDRSSGVILQDAKWSCSGASDLEDVPAVTVSKRLV